MNRNLIINYWLIIIAWSLYLNSYRILATLAALIATLVLLDKKSEVNYWRAMALGLLEYIVVIERLFNSNIPYFYPSLNVFLCLICLNSVVTFEHILSVRSKYLVKMALITLISILILSSLILFMPKDLYSLFSKESLFLMEAFIFLPYLIPMELSILVHCIRRYLKKHHSVLSSNKLVLNRTNN